MLNILKEVRELRQAGKLHNKLIVRTRMLIIISLILGAIVIYNLIFRGTNPWIALLLAAIGFVLGLSVFARMSVVNWDEEKEVVSVGRMDTIGFVTLALYILFEIGLRTVLKEFYPASATVFILAAIFGSLLGRAIGTVIEIHRIYTSAR
jgi:hypothetical protein